MDNKERLKGIRQEFIKNCSNLIDELNKIDPQLKSNLHYNVTRLIEEFEYIIDTSENHVKVEEVEPLQGGIYQQISRLGRNSSFGIALSHNDVAGISNSGVYHSIRGEFITGVERLNGSNYR